MEDSAADGTVVPGFGAAGDNDAAADEEGVAAGLASPGVELLHPVITAMGMIARKATNEMRRVVFIIFASTFDDVPQRWTFRVSPIRFRGATASVPWARRHPSELPAGPVRRGVVISVHR